MRLSLIAAVSENGIIGRGGELPWHLPADLRRFKALTMGHHLLVGRKTWESIGRPLPGRTMVVISRRPGYAPAGVRVARSLEEAVALAAAAGEEEAFVGGGEALYRAALPQADRLYLTRVGAEVPGDARFPAWREEEWELVAHEDHPADERHAFPFRFLTYDRVRIPYTRAP